MKILIVCSGNRQNISPFILDQVEAIGNNNIEFDYYFVNGKGILGYLENLPLLKSKIKEFNPDIVHAHYGLSGLLAVLQRKKPVVVTFHGSDINKFSVKPFSKIADFLCKKSIFVNRSMARKLFSRHAEIIPCGVDLNTFKVLDNVFKEDFKNINWRKINILFSSRFNNGVKNYPLAKEAIEQLKEHNINLIELKGYSREEVCKLMNLVDVCLLSSFSEGSPQFIKEAMACNKPIVTTNVGDVKWLLDGVDGCFIAESNATDFSIKLNEAISFATVHKYTNGRDKIVKLKLDNITIADKIINTYRNII